MKKRKKKPKPPPVIPKKIKVGKFYIEGKVGRIGMPTGGRCYSRNIMEREIKRLTAQLASVVSSDGDEAMTKDEKPGMLALAEASCTHKQICAILYKEARRLLNSESHWTQRELVLALTRFCNRKHWTQFQKKKTVEQVAARAIYRQTYYPLRGSD